MLQFQYYVGFLVSYQIAIWIFVACFQWTDSNSSLVLEVNVDCGGESKGTKYENYTRNLRKSLQINDGWGADYIMVG